MANDTDKITERSAIFDECVAGLPVEIQNELFDLVEWVGKNVLTKGGGTMSAKELIIQSLRFKERREVMTR